MSYHFSYLLSVFCFEFIIFFKNTLFSKIHKFAKKHPLNLKKEDEQEEDQLSGKEANNYYHPLINPVT